MMDDIQELSDRGALMRRLYEAGLTYEHIGCLFGFSRERARQLSSKAGGRGRPPMRFVDKRIDGDALQSIVARLLDLGFTLQLETPMIGWHSCLRNCHCESGRADLSRYL